MTVLLLQQQQLLLLLPVLNKIKKNISPLPYFCIVAIHLFLIYSRLIDRSINPMEKNPNQRFKVPERYVTEYETTQPINVDHLDLSEMDKSTLRRMDNIICSLEDNMPKLSKGDVTIKPSYCILSYTWEAPRFYIDLSVLNKRLMDDAYVRNAYMGTQGLFVHIWKYDELIKTLQKPSSTIITTPSAPPITPRMHNTTSTASTTQTEDYRDEEADHPAPKRARTGSYIVHQ